MISENAFIQNKYVAVSASHGASGLIPAAVYARYSSHNQTEQSIEGQLHDAYEYAARSGYAIIEEYIDRAKSGTRDDRKDFQRMIADAAKQQFRVVLVWKTDRFARNRYDSAHYKAKLKKYGIQVVSVKESISDSPEGIIMEGLLESMAEYYSANLSQNVKRGLRETYSKGLFAGGYVPYGYKLIQGKLYPDEMTAPIVRYIFNEYAAGVGRAKILETLREQGVKSPMGNDLKAGTFAPLLTNPVYYGKLIRTGIEVNCVVEPLISEELFNRVQERVAQHKFSPASMKARAAYLLQGKCFCGMCGAPMVGESGKGKMGPKYYYYACSNKKKLHTCGKRNMKKDDLEKTVVRQAIAFIRKTENVEKIVHGVLAAYEKENGLSFIQELEQKAQRLEKSICNVIDAIADTPKERQGRLKEKLSRLEDEKAELEVKIAKLKLVEGIQLTEKDIHDWLKRFEQGDPEDEEFRKYVIDTLIDSVYVFDDKILILFNLTRGRHLSLESVKSQIPQEDESNSNATLSLCSGFGFDRTCPAKTLDFSRVFFYATVL